MKKQKLEEEAMQAQEFRLMSLETMGQTKKRRAGNVTSEDESPTSTKKRRSSSNDTITYLRGKGVRDGELKKQELAIRKKETENMQQFFEN